jgi:copper(I)-binding protein
MANGSAQAMVDPRCKTGVNAFRRGRARVTGAILACAGILVAATAWAASGSLKIADAWVPALEKAGGDVPLSMTIQNESGDPDALLRVRCPVANFSERHTVDRGEGAPAMRAIKSIPIDTSGAVTLKPDGYHVMLLQTKQLTAGDKFTCSISFQKAGTMEVEVEVRQSH